MTYSDTEILIQKYLNGETTTEEERLLALEVSRDDAPDDWKVIAEMLGELTVDEALFDQMMAERKRKHRIVKLWPWVAAACVAALLIVFLDPPRKVAPSKPQIAKVTSGRLGDSAHNAKQTVRLRKSAQTTKRPDDQTTRQIVRLGKSAQTTKRPDDQTTRQIARLGKSARTTKRPDNQTTRQNATLRPVEEGDIVPYEDPMMQFAEQARTLRERGNRVIQRVSMNSIPLENYPLTDL